MCGHFVGQTNTSNEQEHDGLRSRVRRFVFPKSRQLTEINQTQTKFTTGIPTLSLGNKFVDGGGCVVKD